MLRALVSFLLLAHAEEGATYKATVNLLADWLAAWKSDFVDVDDKSIRNHWALLVAGSSGWYNYRHQADVSHAYQVLRSGGMQAQHIVVMMYDDLANDPGNPFPGQIYNRPGGPDVYEGIQIDYRGDAVNAQTVLAVLEGNKTAVRGKGSGKVIASGPLDRVFLFYSDHGSPGVLGMPSGPFLYADQLHASIARKRAAGGYKEMTLYIEACESGSMFEGLLRPDDAVYASTAANAVESSWGCYCPGLDADVTEPWDTCLGDLFSVSWMEDAECEDGTKETIGTQFDIVKQRTSNNFTYNMGSHVMEYGNLAIRREHTSSYIGPRQTSACIRPAPSEVLSGTSSGPEPLTSLDKGKRSSMRHHVQQREADLMPLRVKVARAKTGEERHAAQAALDAAISARHAVDQGLQEATQQLLISHPAASLQLLTALRQPQLILNDGTPGAGRMQSTSHLLQQHVQLLMTAPLQRPPGTPLVDDWDCLRAMVDAYSHVCGPLDQYAMKHTRLFANLCNAGLDADSLTWAMQSAGSCATAVS